MEGNVKRQPMTNVASALGRSRGGLTTKIHALMDGHGRPLCHLLALGQAADCRHVQALLEGVSFAWLIGDRAYDTDALRVWCADHTVEVVISSKRNRKVPIPHDQVTVSDREPLQPRERLHADHPAQRENLAQLYRLRQPRLRPHQHPTLSVDPSA